MKTTKVKKDFDCIEFKRQVQARIYEEIKDLSPEEEIEYFRKAAETGPFADWWRKVCQRTQAASAEAKAE